MRHWKIWSWNTWKNTIWKTTKKKELTGTMMKQRTSQMKQPDSTNHQKIYKKTSVYWKKWLIATRKNWLSLIRGLAAWLSDSDILTSTVTTFKSRLSLIVRVNLVLNRTVVVDSYWHIDNLCASHVQSQSELYYVSWWYYTPVNCWSDWSITSRCYW